VIALPGIAKKTPKIWYLLAAPEALGFGGPDPALVSDGT
jgi:hypothetical protein